MQTRQRGNEAAEAFYIFFLMHQARWNAVGGNFSHTAACTRLHALLSQFSMRLRVISAVCTDWQSHPHCDQRGCEWKALEGFQVPNDPRPISQRMTWRV